MSIASVSHFRAFGISPTVCKDNLYYIDESTIIYPAGCNAIVADIEQKTQRFIPCSEKAEAISAITVSTDRHTFAVAERTSSKPLIAIYDLHSYRKRKALNPSSESQGLSREFVSMTFSSDTRYIVAQLGSPEWILHYYSWEKGKVLGTVAINPPKTLLKKGSVVEVGVCPSDGCQLSVLGDSFSRIYRYLEGGVTLACQVHADDGEAFQCHAWLANERIAIGTSNSRILITAGSHVNQVIPVGPARNLQPNCSIMVIRSTMKGFIAAGQYGTVDMYDRSVDPNTKEDMYMSSLQVSLPEEAIVVRTMTVSGTESSLIALSETNVMHKVQLSGADIKGADVRFEVAMPAYHHGPVTGMDVCTRKPILVTTSSDRSIRIWNYATGECELCKHFPEEASSVAIHPSGLYVLVGFGDKLRLMNVLIDDFRLFKEFPIRSCRECCFSNGGHVFAAAHGNMIQLYSVWTFENYGNLKGHNGKVRSLHWTPDDAVLVSAGSDGAVYSWIVRDLKRDGESIHKNCSYTSAVCTPDGKSIYAVGSDRLLKEITESAISCQLDSTEVLTQLAISNSGRMMFAGTAKGALRSMKYPLTGEAEDFQQHQVHSAGVSRFRVSCDDTMLFSAGEDGTVYLFKVMDRSERGIKKERAGALFSDEILITKSDLEEKTVVMAELRRSLEELKLEHEYQLRLKDMNFNEKLKELTEKYSQEIEALKIGTSVLRAEKEKEEVKQEEQVQSMKTGHMNELHDIEARYNTELMEEYEKFQALQTKSGSMQEQWQRQMKEYDSMTQRSLAQSQKDAEERLAFKQTEISKLNELMAAQTAESTEIAAQNAQDIDHEITLLHGRYERRLRAERDEGARLKGENGIMRKKFNTLNKDIEDNRTEAVRMREDEKKLRAVITMLEKEIAGFKKEMGERDELIQDKERRVYELKKKNQELEKYKFVMDYQIKELKEQVEPRENEITVMTEQISDINQELATLHSLKQTLEQEIESLHTKLSSTKQAYASSHAHLHTANQTLKAFRTSLEHAVGYIQDPPLLRKSVQGLVAAFCTGDDREEMGAGLKKEQVEGDVREEYGRQTEALLGEIRVLRRTAAEKMDMYRMDGILSMVDNKALIQEIGVLRRMARHKMPSVFSVTEKRAQHGQAAKQLGPGSGVGGSMVGEESTELPKLPPLAATGSQSSVGIRT